MISLNEIVTLWFFGP